MVPFRGYGRLTRSTTLALLTTLVILGAEWADLLPDNVMLAVHMGCQVYVLLRVMRARISPAYLLLWGPFVWFFPITTALLFFLFGGRKHSSLAEAKKEVNRVAWRLSDEPDIGGNRFRLLGDRDGRDTLEELRQQIKGAKRRISLSTYILSDDAVGREIVSLLTARAREGIEVRLLVDAIGSFGIPLRLCRPLRRAGGKVARFNPALPMQGKGSANWRNHRKIAVFDGAVAIIGGQNLGLRYMGDKPSNRRFRDCSFLIEGPTSAAAGISARCARPERKSFSSSRTYSTPSSSSSTTSNSSSGRRTSICGRSFLTTRLVRLYATVRRWPKSARSSRAGRQNRRTTPKTSTAAAAH